MDRTWIVNGIETGRNQKVKTRDAKHIVESIFPAVKGYACRKKRQN